MAIKTAWALNSERQLINISQLDRDKERGSKCNCSCISCGSRLVARMGDHKAYHFAHSSEHSCSIESIQHQLAKAIIAESISDEITTAPSNPIHQLLNHKVQIEAVDLEKALGNGKLIADCFVNRDHEPFAIEIFYTNKKSSVHIDKYHEIDLSALEIDVSGMNLHLNREELKHFVLRDAPRKWLKKAEPEQEPVLSAAYDGIDWITAEDAIESLDELYKNGRLYDFIGAIGTCGESSFRRREKISVMSVEGVVESNEHYVLARGCVNKGIPVDILFPLGDYTPQDYISPTLMVELDVWGSHHRANWHGIDKWKEKLQYQANQEAKKKEERRLKRPAAQENELTIEDICELYKSSSSLSNFYLALAEKSGLDLSNLPFMDNQKMMINWQCPRVVWRAIVALVFIKQGKELECDTFAYDLYMGDAFGWDSHYAENRSKEVYFWLEKHFEDLGAKRKRLSYRFYKSKQPKNFDSVMLSLITS